MTIDWHGDNAKRKRDNAVRRATVRAFVIGAMLAVIGVGALAVFGLSQAVPPQLITQIVSATPLPTATSDPLTATAAEAAARTLIAVALTGGAPTRTPTTAATVPAGGASTNPDQVAQFRAAPDSSGQKQLTFVQWLPIQAEPGYQFRGAQFDPHGLLYIAHSRGEGDGIAQCNMPADADDAYWIIDVSANPPYRVGELRDPMLVSPKRIAFDSKGNAYVLAADCKQQSYAVFSFNAQGRWVDTFPIIGGIDLAVSADDRLFVAVTGYASATVPQAHLLELRRDQGSGALQQVAQFNSGNPAGFYRALLAGTPSDATLWGAWVEPNVPERLARLGVSTADDSGGTPGSADLQSLDTSQGIPIPAVDNLARDQQRLFGLSLSRRAIGALSDTPIQVIPFSGLYARTLAVQGNSFYMAGPPDAPLVAGSPIPPTSVG